MSERMDLVVGRRNAPRRLEERRKALWGVEIKVEDTTLKVSVIISASDKREKLFERSLDTWARQTMPKEDFEILVMDDWKREGLRQLCAQRAQQDGMNIRYMRIDYKRNRKIRWTPTFIPVLTNNVGFRKARGEVVVITGPETLQASRNLEVAWSMRNREECGYGLVWRANPGGTDKIAKDWEKLKNAPMEQLLEITGVKNECVTMPPHKPEYWYLMAVARKHVIDIGGVDERFSKGICGEDTDIANRMKMIGVEPVFEHAMIGIHQDHSREDAGDGKHINRKEGKGYNMWVHNFRLMEENLRRQDPNPNRNRDWGSWDMIVLDEIHDAARPEKSEGEQE